MVCAVCRVAVSGKPATSIGGREKKTGRLHRAERFKQVSWEKKCAFCSHRIGPDQTPPSHRSHKYPGFDSHAKTDQNQRFRYHESVFSTRALHRCRITLGIVRRRCTLPGRPHIDVPIRFNISRSAISDPMYAKVDSATVN